MPSAKYSVIRRPDCSALRSCLRRNISGRVVLQFGREIVFILAIYLFFQLCTLLIYKIYPNEQLKQAALGNAQNVVKFESIFGLYQLELLVQKFFVHTLNVAIIMRAINTFYLGFHLPISLIFFFHLASFRIVNERNSRSQSASSSPTPSTPLEVIIDKDPSPTSSTPIQHSVDLAAIDKNSDPQIINHETPLLRRHGYFSVRNCLRSCWRKFKELIWLNVTVTDFKRFRWILILLHLLFAITITAYPVAPPRMLPEKGYVDTIVLYSRTDMTGTEERLGVNPYAAFPSLHFAYALFVGVGYYRFADKRWLRVMGVLYTISMGFTIVITGNHYIIDAIGSLIYCAIALYASFAIVNYTSRHTWRAVHWVEAKCESLCDKIFGPDSAEFSKPEDEQLHDQTSLIVQG
jgi:membrane-associated phospholipid phosphatase